MLKRLSVNVLLKSVIVVISLAVVVMLAMSSWASWRTWKAQDRIVTVVEISGYLFTALHNLRVDRSTTNRDLQLDQTFTTLNPQLRQARDAEMAALRSALPMLAMLDFRGKQTIFPQLRDGIDKLAALQDESAKALSQPKASRRPALVQEYVAKTTELFQMIDKLSSELAQNIKLENAYIDQLMVLKQLAWLSRNAGGDASLIVSNGVAGQPLAPDAFEKFSANEAKFEAAWKSLEETAAGLPLPRVFTDAVEKARKEYLAKDFLDMRRKLLKTMISGEKAGIPLNDWTVMSVSKLSTLLAIAEAALEVAGEYAATERAAAIRALSLQVILLTAALLLAFFMMLIVSWRVTSPLRDIQSAMLKLAGGDFSVVLPGLDRKDEIGDVANAVEQFKLLAVEKAKSEADESLRRQQAEAESQARAAEERAKAAEAQTEAFRVLGAGLSKLAEGDVTFRVTGQFAEEYRQIKDDFNTAMIRLQETVRNIAVASAEVSNAASEISVSTTDLSQRTEEQAASIEQTSASMEEMAATVKKNAENAQHANQLTQATRDVAARGGQVVTEAVTAMARIEESSGKISDIISVIDEIARQTNLLALNAAVEAARAGEAGRGFAVVASEVRSLAQRSSQAAKDIKDLITSSSSQVRDGVQLVNRAGASLSEILESIKNVAAIVGDIANASAEQSSGIEQINKALNQMDEVTQQNSALVEENAATAKTLEDQQRAMSEQVGFFHFDDSGTAAPAAPARVAAASSPAKPAAPRAPIQRRGRAPAVAGNTALAESQEWEEF
jgi:methyl-accepting chemotaxis protein